MTRNKLMIGLMATCLSTLLPLAARSAQAATAKASDQTQPADMPIYGSQLMTEQERTSFRARMWAAKTDEERNRIRSAHHEEMKTRAQAKGVTLPDMPPVMPVRGVGPGSAMRQGADMAPPCAASAPPCAASGARSGRRIHRGAGRMLGR